MSSPRTARIVLCLVAAGLWGLWWAPIRWLESAGMEGPYAGLAMNIGALPVLLAGALVWRGRMGWQAALGAIAVGGAVTLYASALLFTDVVRCVLLFYLAPAWSTLIECMFMGRRWNLRSTLALSMSLLGAVLVFRGDISLAALNSGDAMALGAGVVWSVGAALIFLQQERNPAGLALMACFAAVVMGGAFALFTGPVPAGETILAATPLAIGTGAVFLAPILGITLWAALNLPPATVTFLMTAEIITGVVSSAMFLDVRFGLPEALGTVLIATAALVEVVAPSPEVMRAGEERA